MAIFAGKNFGYNGCNEGTLTFNRLFAGESAFLGFYDPREEKIMKKKLVSVILAGAMALCLAGCGGNTTTDTENGSSSLGDLVNSAIDDAVNNAVDEANSALTDAADQVSDVVDDVNAGLEEATGAASEGVMSAMYRLISHGGTTRFPYMLRMKRADTSFTTLLAPRKMLQSLPREPRSELPVTRPCGLRLTEKLSSLRALPLSL